MDTYDTLKQKHIETYNQETQVVDKIFSWFNSNHKIHPKYYDPAGVDLQKAKEIETRIGERGLIDLIKQRDALRVKLDDIAKKIKKLDPWRETD